MQGASFPGPHLPWRPAAALAATAALVASAAIVAAIALAGEQASTWNPPAPAPTVAQPSDPANPDSQRPAPVIIRFPYRPHY